MPQQAVLACFQVQMIVSDQMGFRGGVHHPHYAIGIVPVGVCLEVGHPADVPVSQLQRPKRLYWRGMLSGPGGSPHRRHNTLKWLNST